MNKDLELLQNSSTCYTPRKILQQIESKGRFISGDTKGIYENQMKWR